MSRPAQLRSPRIDVVVPAQREEKISRLFIEDAVAQLVRKCARAEQQTHTKFLETVLKFWIAQERPEWTLTETIDA